MPDCSDTSSLPWRRHDLLRVAPDIWASVLVHCPSLANLPLVASWADRGWPVILRRRAEADDPALLPVGLPLPPAAGKRRIALLLPPEGVLQRSSPPLLRAAGRVADPGWRSTIASLLALGARTGVEPSAFGSLLWQHQIGLTYLSPHSDLDVLWPVPPGVDVLSLFFGIAEVQRQAPLRIDGEVDPSAVGRKNGPFPRVSLVAPRRRRSLDRTSSGHSAREAGTGAVAPQPSSRLAPEVKTGPSKPL